MKLLKITSLLAIAIVVAAFTSRMESEKTIAEMVSENQELSTLLTALQKAELVETFKGEGPYTVFAPTNTAFSNLPAGKLDNLLKDENRAELAKLLKYHVVSGTYYASDLSDGQTLKTLEGTVIKIGSSASMDEEMMEDEAESNSPEIRINNANVIESDITAANGVIHLIDAVVMPTDVETMGTVEDYQ